MDTIPLDEINNITSPSSEEMFELNDLPNEEINEEINEVSNNKLLKSRIPNSFNQQLNVPDKIEK